MWLKDNYNSVIIFGIVPLHENLNNKAHEINNRLVRMCKKRNIPFILRVEVLSGVNISMRVSYI